MNIDGGSKAILLVDDSDESRLITKWFLSSLGYAVECARSAAEALAVFDPRVHDLVVTENSMSGMTGAEFAHIVKMRSLRTPVVMYTGSVPENQSCLDSVIAKPAHLLSLHEAISSLLQPASPEATIHLPLKATPDLRQDRSPPPSCP